jgi:hypothetical protein
LLGFADDVDIVGRNIRFHRDIVKRIKVNKLRWPGHAVRRPVEAILFKVFKSDFVDGKRSLGQPKNSWKQAVDKDSIVLGIRNWQAVASDRASYRRQLRKNHNRSVGPAKEVNKD